MAREYEGNFFERTIIDFVQKGETDIPATVVGAVVGTAELLRVEIAYQRERLISLFSPKNKQ